MVIFQWDLKKILIILIVPLVILLSSNKTTKGHTTCLKETNLMAFFTEITE